eukprot:TRINITY_DN2941_c0_g1_i2.p1 TRINITY_DN2941_c0_g1~~TRINITY_DN2941_c0_g1_i2.p1  ORF type:complete len:168 (+),score=45.21 TRINITY_DN2941_c0_g1_i2:45-548(+)
MCIRDSTTTDHSEPVEIASALPPLKILLVEDEAINQKVEEKILKKLGYTPDIASDGVAAVEMVRTTRYDVVFMDIMMPRMDGFAASKRIREFFPDRPPIILAVSAGALKENVVKCEEAGMDDFISKPVNLKLFQEALMKWTSVILRTREKEQHNKRRRSQIEGSRKM